jgi:uncharacterized protein (TIGR04222 family)
VFEVPQQRLDFVRRLAREQRWTLGQARAAVLEYRRFCFLQTLHQSALTPSGAVDQVWHLHLTHTQDYWQQWCPDVLQRALHHQPTTGGERQAQTYAEQYALTLALYERYFGQAPFAWWPPTAQRFAHTQRWAWVDRSQVWLLPRPRWPRLPRLLWHNAAIVLIAVPATAGALGINPLSWPATAFLSFYCIGALLLWVGSRVWLRHLMRSLPAVPVNEPLLPLDVAFLAGGARRVAETCITDALVNGVLQFDPSSRRLIRGGTRNVDTHSELADATANGQGLDRDAAFRVAAPAAERVRRKLEQLGYCLEPSQTKEITTRTAWLLQLWLILGVLKIAVGIMGDMPVGLLIVVCVLIGLAVANRRGTSLILSVSGEQALAQVRKRHQRLQRAPQNHELALAVALVGMSILSETALADWHQAQAPGRSTGDSSSSGDSSSDGGCGGCGGGGD